MFQEICMLPSWYSARPMCSNYVPVQDGGNCVLLEKCVVEDVLMSAPLACRFLRLCWRHSG